MLKHKTLAMDCKVDKITSTKIEKKYQISGFNLIFKLD